jgi:hypothetical protein
MRRDWTRRDILRTSTGAALGVGIGGWNGITSEAATPPLSHADDAKIQRLAELIIATDPDRVVDVMAKELEGGLSRQHFLAANFIAGIRFQGHHYAYVAHPVNVVANAVAEKDSLLPMFYHLGALKFGVGRDRLRSIDTSTLPSIRTADESFHTAMTENDHNTAVLSFLSLAREYGPRRAYDELWMYGAERNHRSGGHTAISVINTFRTLQAIDWRCPETVLQFAVEDSAVGKAGGTDLHAVNRDRAAQVKELSTQWSRSMSDREAVLDLVDSYRQGRPEEACKSTFELLREGKVFAGSVWDAVFLTTAELVTRYQWVGTKMLAGHSVTCANAMHFVFRSAHDPVARLYALLEAVEWTTSFLKRERSRPALRKRSILEIADVELTADDESPERIFSIIPIRRRRQTSPILLPEADKANELAFAWAKQTKDHTAFFQEALRLLCLKSTTEVHDFKYPLALFENYRYASDEWKPHLLAASVYVLHGTQMEDGQMVGQARERLGLQ